MNVDRADLKKAVLKLIADVHSIHHAGGGTLRVAELAMKLRVPTDATTQQALSERGDVIFSATGADSGVFENRGNQMRLPTNVTDVVIPPVIAGTYISTADNLILQMDSGQTIIGKKAFLSAPLESISATQKQVSVRIGGFLSGLLSKTISFSDVT